MTTEKTKPMFSKADVGCWADGSFGHKHIRNTLASMVEGLVLGEKSAELAKELHADPSDDEGEEDEALDLLNQHAQEDEALDLLNQHAQEGYSFSFSDGDLIFSKDSDEN